jgi:hypothetical protein
MPLTNLNIGAAPNDGTGETLRSGGAKINTNYTFTVTTDTNQDIGGIKTFTLQTIFSTSARFSGGLSNFASVVADGAIYRSSVTTGTYPFNAIGNLVIQPRLDASAGSRRDVVFAVGSSSAPTVAMVVARTGNVGIGTTNPGAKLEVSSSTTGVTSGDLVVDTVNKEVSVGRVSSTSGDNSILVLRSRTNDRFSLSNLGSESRLNVETSNAFTVRTNNVERMRIAADGNVGIGTTSPDSLLHVGTATAITGGGQLTTSGFSSTQGIWQWFEAPQSAGTFTITISRSSGDLGGITLDVDIQGRFNTTNREGYAAYRVYANRQTTSVEVDTVKAPTNKNGTFTSSFAFTVTKPNTATLEIAIGKPSGANYYIGVKGFFLIAGNSAPTTVSSSFV